MEAASPATGLRDNDAFYVALPWPTIGWAIESGAAGYQRVAVLTAV